MPRGVLRSFAYKDTERVWRRERSRRLGRSTRRAALRKLLILDAAGTLDDTKLPPGNRLETLRGDRVGRYRIRVNLQWRICFRWTPAGPEDIEISRTERRIDNMSTTAALASIHPGEILAEEYITPLGVTQHKLAAVTPASA
jgi:toxin HigB-1